MSVCNISSVNGVNLLNVVFITSSELELIHTLSLPKYNHVGTTNCRTNGNAASFPRRASRSCQRSSEGCLRTSSYKRALARSCKQFKCLRWYSQNREAVAEGLGGSEYLAKKAASASRQSASATGGGPSTAPPISETDRRIISIMGEGFGSQQVEGRVPAFYPDREPAASASTAAPHEGASQDDILLELPVDAGQPPPPEIPPQVSQLAESSSQNQSQAQPARRVLRARRGLPANSLGSQIMTVEEQRLNIEQRRLATEEAIFNEIRLLRMAIVEAIQTFQRQ